MQDTVDQAPSPWRGRPTEARAGLKIGHGRVAVHSHRAMTWWPVRQMPGADPALRDEGRLRRRVGPGSASP
jgi:hypothetical protein